MADLAFRRPRGDRDTKPVASPLGDRATASAPVDQADSTPLPGSTPTRPPTATGKRPAAATPQPSSFRSPTSAPAAEPSGSRRKPGRHRAPSPSACACGSPHCNRRRRGLRGLAATLPMLLGATAFLGATGILPTGRTEPGAVPALPRAPEPSLPAPDAGPHRSGLPGPGVGNAPPPTTPAPAGTAPATPSVAARVRQHEIAAETVAERLEEARTDLQAMTAEQTAATTHLDQTTRDLHHARAALDTATRDSYITAAGRPPGLATDPRRGMFGHPDPRPATALAALRHAETRQQAANTELTRATTAATQQQQAVTDLASDLDRRGKALQRLRAAHRPALAAAQRRQESTDAAQAARYLRDADGRAADAALKAVEFALAQRGKPYEWGAEGPDRYDCSGLVQTAYTHAGIRLPRTARPQYRATPPVPTNALLPGDLLFFATDKTNWNTIHHVAIYLGHGKMLHAPTTGDVVRIAPVWWAEFYAATRVVPAPAKTTPTPRPSPRATPSRTPKPTPSVSPKPTTTPRRTPTRAPTRTPSPTPTRPPPTSNPPSPTPPTPTPTTATPDPSPSLPA